MTNRVEPDESVEVNSNTTCLQRLYEQFQKRKLLWIIFLIILIVVIIVVVTTTLLLNRTKREKTTTITEITSETTEESITSSATTATSSSSSSTTITTGEQLIPSVIIDKNTKWKKDAVTVAGGNGDGSELNQLNQPWGIHVDSDDHSIYIADTSNHRIVRWKSGANNGEVVAGGNGLGSTVDRLNYPNDVVLDKEKKYVIICDYYNERAMKWSLQNNQDHQVLIPSISCFGLAMDSNGDLYISEWDKHQVRRFYEDDRQGTVVAGGNGQGNRLNQLNGPVYIFVDKDHSVYIADDRNNRVMKWMENANEGSLVAPGQVSNENPNSLVQPIGVIVDHMGNIYVSSKGSHQITRWSPSEIEGTPVIGEKQLGSEPTQLQEPQALSFDQQGNLYVVDKHNHRIQKFAIDRD